MALLCCGITVEAKGITDTVTTIDGERAIIATVIAVAAGLAIFCIRNRKMYGNRRSKSYE